MTTRYPHLAETVLASILLVLGLAVIVSLYPKVKPNLKPCVCNGTDTCVYHAKGNRAR